MFLLSAAFRTSCDDSCRPCNVCGGSFRRKRGCESFNCVLLYVSTFHSLYRAWRVHNVVARHTTLKTAQLLKNTTLKRFRLMGALKNCVSAVTRVDLRVSDPPRHSSSFPLVPATGQCGHHSPTALLGSLLSLSVSGVMLRSSPSFPGAVLLFSRHLWRRCNTFWLITLCRWVLCSTNYCP